MHAAGLQLGVDIPLRYDALDEWTGEIPTVVFDGARKTVSEHVIDRVDQVVVMDYRTRTYGADGVLALAEDELEYAGRTGKMVWVGLETTDLPDEELVEFEGEPRRGLPGQAPAGTAVILEARRMEACLWRASPLRWQEFCRQIQASGADAASILYWRVRRTIHVPAAKLTFASLGDTVLQQTMWQALEDLSRRPSFAGFAIHDYAGYLKLRNGSRGVPH